MRTNSYILILSLIITAISSCHPNKSEVNKALYNESASFSGKLGALDATTVLNWHMVTLLKDTKSKEISVLYANDLAFKAVQSKDGHYQAGSGLALVTWLEKPDIHWFGATIPGEITSIKQINMVQDPSGALQPSFSAYVNHGDGLQALTAPDSLMVKKSTTFILGLRRPYLPD